MNNEQINNIPNNHKYLTSVIIIFLISFCALIEIKYSFKKINLIKEEYKTQDIISFKKGHFYKHCFDIFIFLIGVNMVAIIAIDISISFILGLICFIVFGIPPIIIPIKSNIVEK